ncbi:hypothetical protein YC2023_094028 [Brassica napus]
MKKGAKNDVPTGLQIVELMKDFVKRRIKTEWFVRLGECSGGRARRLVRVWERTEKTTQTGYISLWTLSMVVCLAEANGSIGLHNVLGDWLTQTTYGRNSPRPSLGNEPYLADRDHEAEC